MSDPRAERGVPTVYVASKSRLGPLWQGVRSEWAGRVDIIATWIDESEQGATEDHSDLWRRCVAEASAADALIAAHEAGDVWKGAYIEIGAALAAGKPVYIVGNPPGSFLHHPLIKRCNDVDEALRLVSVEDRLRALVSPRAPEGADARPPSAAEPKVGDRYTDPFGRIGTVLAVTARRPTLTIEWDDNGHTVTEYHAADDHDLRALPEAPR